MNFRVEDLDSENDSRQSSPVKTVKPRVTKQTNGHHMSPSKQPKMPQVKEELEPEANHVASIPNGHSNGEVANGGTTNGNGEAATIIKAPEDNHVGEQVPLVAAAE